MTIVDSSVVLDLLLKEGVARQARDLLDREREAAAPDILVFEVIDALRREIARGAVAEKRATSAVADLGDLPLVLMPTLGLRERAWELRENITAADALFVALAEEVGEPLATKDEQLAQAARRHAGVEVVQLG